MASVVSRSRSLLIAATVAAAAVVMSIAAPAAHASTPPSPPTMARALAGTSSAKVVWRVPVSDGGSPITGYTATASPGGATCATTTALNCIVSGLTNGTAYSFTVTATNADGTSSPSTPTAIVTPGTTPSAPRNVTETALNNTVTVNWSPALDDGGAPIDGYEAWNVDGNIVSCLVPANATSCTITGLTPNATYDFVVQAHNVWGMGPAAYPAAPLTIRGPASAPRDVTAGPDYGNSIDVSWSAPFTNGGSPITAYTVVATPGGRSWTFPANRGGCTLLGLVNKTVYRFTVRAWTALGAGAAATSNSIVAGVPSAPRSLMAGFPAAGRVIVYWSGPAFYGSAPVQYYVVTWSADGAHWTPWAGDGRGYATRSGLVKGHRYWIQIRAINNSGAGPAALGTWIQAR